MLNEGISGPEKICYLQPYTILEITKEPEEEPKETNVFLKFLKALRLFIDTFLKSLKDE